MYLVRLSSSRRRHVLAAALALIVALSACNDENSAPPPPVEGEVEINASSNTEFTYFNLGSGQVVAPANPATSSDWDIAFRRYTVRLNGGTGGPKGVQGYNLENNVDATDTEVLAFTPENQLPYFESVDATDIPAASEFTTEGLAPDFTSWFTPTSTGLNPNPLAVWKLRRATGAGAGTYALIHVTAIGNNPPPTVRMTSISFGYRLQTAPGTLGAEQTATLTLPSGTTEAGLNLTTGTQVAPTAGDCAWDIKVTDQYTFEVNAACNAGTFPLDASQTFATATRADDAPQYGAFVAQVSGPIPGSFEDPAGPFLYNLAGDNRLSPTFNVYLVKVGSAVYKVQLTRYYSVTGGASGYPTIRYKQIQ
jgi:hypothetical protein